MNDRSNNSNKKSYDVWCEKYRTHRDVLDRGVACHFERGVLLQCGTDCCPIRLARDRIAKFYFFRSLTSGSLVVRKS